jgi:hypothetical protein
MRFLDVLALKKGRSSYTKTSTTRGPSGRIRTPNGGRYAPPKGQEFLVAPSMVLTVIGCRNGSARLDVQAVITHLSSFQDPKEEKHHDFVPTNLRHFAG